SPGTRSVGGEADGDRSDRHRDRERADCTSARSMSTDARRIAVVIPAGGSGERMGGVIKPLLSLAGVPLLQRSVQPFLDRDDVHWVIVALPAELAARPPAWLMGHTRVDVVAGGAHRGDSVRRALSVVPMEADLVIVHDAARPLVTADL